MGLSPRLLNLNPYKILILYSKALCSYVICVDQRRLLGKIFYQVQFHLLDKYIEIFLSSEGPKP
jgi:hypothetical protein